MRARLLLALSLAAMTASAQQDITPEVLGQLRGASEMSVAERAIGNALQQQGGINKMSLVTNNQQTKDTYFSVEIANTGITNQESSGRCWLFTGTNVLRNKAMKKLGIKNFTFSHVYLFFYDQLEKSNLFLQSIIDTRKQPIDSQQVQWLMQNPLSDGGTYTGVADLVTKYGLVPSDVMQETYPANNTSEFNGHLKRKLREIAINLRDRSDKGESTKQLEAYKVEQLKTVYRLLTLAYGTPVEQFTWAPRNDKGKFIVEPKTYTPQEFYRELCGQDDDLQEDYVMLMNDPSRPYNKVYEIDMDRHVYDGHNWLYLNLSIDDLAPLAIASLKDSTQMYFSCDVGKQFNRAAGLLDVKNYDYGSLLGTTFGMDKRQRIQTRDSGSSHAMTLMAVDLDQDGKPTKWKVENSWGASSGYAGHLIMTHEWFREYMFRVVVNKKYCTPEVLSLLKQKPVRLPAWDPMFMPEK